MMIQILRTTNVVRNYLEREQLAEARVKLGLRVYLTQCYVSGHGLMAAIGWGCVQGTCPSDTELARVLLEHDDNAKLDAAS